MKQKDKILEALRQRTDVSVIVDSSSNKPKRDPNTSITRGCLSHLMG